jgi:hypothetical protein
MAKQTFTTGQVLTAAQMQSLQNTALGGGDATPKVASYVLVSADAGTTVAMNAAGATTITVNTGLFAAGDTVFIQNRGAGACTVTAGTATVATAGSLILPQNDAGILYFTSPSAAIFYDYIQAGAVSPLTTKGDLYTFSTSDARLGVGANGTTLVADSAEATGLKWATASSGGMTLISSTTLTGAGITLSSIPQTYNDLRIYIKNYKPVSASGIGCRVNGLSTTIYRSNQEYSEAGADNRSAAGTYWEIFARNQNTSTSESLADYVIPDYTNATTWKYVSGRSIANNPTTATNYNFATFWAPVRQTAAITQLEFFSFGGDFTSGTLLLYGVK